MICPEQIPSPQKVMSEIEIPQDVTAAAILISNWMKEHGHDRWELFDLCSRNHATELACANAKLATLSRLIDLAQNCDDAKSEAELAASASLSEALAYTNAELLEKERDQARGDVNRLLGELEKARRDLRSVLQSASHYMRNFREADVKRIEAERERDEWKSVADILNHALGNDGIEANNPLSHQARTAALKLFASKKK